MAKANILVTGGAGYIGSHVCKALYNAGFTPVAYDNLVTGNKHAVKWGPFEEGDILDQKRLSAVIKEHKIDAVVHMAAFIAVGESVENPGKYYRNNSVGGLNLLEAMKENDVKTIVFSSTAAVYGLPETVPIVESAELAPINPYGFSKLMVEQMLKDFETAHDFRSVSFRYFNVAGSDPDREIGCDQEKPNNLIPIIMQVLSGKREHLEIFGTDYDTPDGTAIRDYIHVTDLARAHVDALNYLLDGGDSMALNLGTGTGHSVRDVVQSVERATNQKIAVKEAPRRAGDPPVLYSNADKAQKVLQWTPEFTALDTITKTAWFWEINKNNA